MIRLICVVVVLLAVAGCAPIQTPEPRADHPACPDAAHTENAEMSAVLNVDEENLPQTPPEIRRGMMHHGHGQMNGAMRGANTPETLQADRYTCTMHPGTTMETSGKCPVCGMQLVPVKGGPADE